jgi:hypothetical protein
VGGHYHCGDTRQSQFSGNQHFTGVAHLLGCIGSQGHQRRITVHPVRINPTGEAMDGRSERLGRVGPLAFPRLPRLRVTRHRQSGWPRGTIARSGRVQRWPARRPSDPRGRAVHHLSGPPLGRPDEG